MTFETIYTNQPKVSMIHYYTAAKLLYIKNQTKISTRKSNVVVKKVF